MCVYVCIYIIYFLFMHVYVDFETLMFECINIKLEIYQTSQMRQCYFEDLM